jgi:uncharacterized RDD family membrane protein YckC
VTTKQCPNCGIINPLSSNLCDCGWNFEKQVLLIPDSDLHPRVHPYAGFWVRLLALMVDGAVLWIIHLILMFPQRYSKVAFAFTELLWVAIASAYVVLLHARDGQTLGKKLVSIKVTRVNGEPINWRDALIRQSPSIAMYLLSLIGGLVAVSSLTMSEFSAMGLFARNEMLKKDPLITPVGIISTLFTIGEVISLMLSFKKQTLHDRLANTVVVKKW